MDRIAIIKMKKSFAIIIFSLSIISCNPHENKNRYEVPVNGKVEIFFPTNSCCFLCVANEKQLKHVKLIESRAMDTVPSDCDGCNYTKAFVFEGKSVGIDTVELKSLGAKMDCDIDLGKLERYIIEVK